VETLIWSGRLSRTWASDAEIVHAFRFSRTLAQLRARK
jgi:hypothetical protein